MTRPTPFHRSLILRAAAAVATRMHLSDKKDEAAALATAVTLVCSEFLEDPPDPAEVAGRLSNAESGPGVAELSKLMKAAGADEQTLRSLAVDVHVAVAGPLFAQRFPERAANAADDERDRQARWNSSDPGPFDFEGTILEREVPHDELARAKQLVAVVTRVGARLVASLRAKVVAAGVSKDLASDLGTMLRKIPGEYGWWVEGMPILLLVAEGVSSGTSAEAVALRASIVDVRTALVLLHLGLKGMQTDAFMEPALGEARRVLARLEPAAPPWIEDVDSAVTGSQAAIDRVLEEYARLEKLGKKLGEAGVDVPRVFEAIDRFRPGLEQRVAGPVEVEEYARNLVETTDKVIAHVAEVYAIDAAQTLAHAKAGDLAEQKTLVAGALVGLLAKAHEAAAARRRRRAVFAVVALGFAAWWWFSR